MFVLMVVKDTVRLAPPNFDKDHDTAILDVLHAKYANRVLAGHGLCLAVDGFDPQTTGDALIYANDGGCHVRVQFRLIMFRPFVSEVLIGKIRQCDASGILVSVEFFDHIFIPKECLQRDSEFNAEEKIWTWNFGDHQLSMDLGEEIQFRVSAVEYGKRRTATDNPEDEKVMALGDIKPPLRIIGTIAEDGLGLLSWWTQPTEQPAEADKTDDKADSNGAAGDDAATAAATTDSATAAAPAGTSTVTVSSTAESMTIDTPAPAAAAAAAATAAAH